MVRRIKSALKRHIKNRLKPYMPRVHRLVALLLPPGAHLQRAAGAATPINEELLVELDDLIRETMRLQMQVTELQDMMVKRMDRLEAEFCGAQQVRAVAG